MPYATYYSSSVDQVSTQSLDDKGYITINGAIDAAEEESLTGLGPITDHVICELSRKAKPVHHRVPNLSMRRALVSQGPSGVQKEVLQSSEPDNVVLSKERADDVMVNRPVDSRASKLDPNLARLSSSCDLNICFFETKKIHYV